MELKEARAAFQRVEEHGFNRTFMELKVVKDEDGERKTMFQSHLYGIESRTRRGSTTGHDGFNRTFMELKDINNPDELKKLFVSIAPLWN